MEALLQIFFLFFSYPLTLINNLMQVVTGETSTGSWFDFLRASRRLSQNSTSIIGVEDDGIDIVNKFIVYLTVLKIRNSISFF